MDAANFRAVVIQERHDSIFEGRLDFDLLVHFAFDPRPVSGLIPGKKRFVAVVQMAANPDRALGDEALFAGFLAPDVNADTLLPYVINA